MINKAQIAVDFNIDEIRERFPILHQEINGYPLAYLDNAATTQKPKEVIESITSYYSNYNANIHRGIHTLAEKATLAFEETRSKAQRFINAAEKEEIIFTKGTTEGINLIAQSLAAIIKEGDEIIVSGIEHHSNMVPWQNLCQQKGATLKIIPFFENGELDISAFKNLLSEKTRLVSVNHASNALGTINPLEEIIALTRQTDAWILVDGAQAASHLEIDVQKLDVDFYVLSGHKMYGPTGVGVLYGKREILEKIPPYQFGGEMIKNVSYENTTYNDIPYKFEAGTPNIAGVIGLGSAIDFINNIGKDNIRRWEDDLLDYATSSLESIEGIKFYGTSSHKVSVVSFLIDGIHPFDAGQMLDARGVAVRTGHHCTEPIMTSYGIDGTIRASFAVYNTKAEVDQLTEGLSRLKKFIK